MRSKMEARKYCHTMWGGYDVSLIMVAIKGPTYKFDRNKNHSHALHDSNRNFCQYYQTGHTAKTQYLEIFNNKVYVIYLYGGSIRMESGLAKADLTEIVKNSSYLKNAERQRAIKAAKQK